MNNPEPQKSPVSRRTLVGAAAWMAPAIAMTVASPAAAASAPSKPAIEFTKVPPAVTPGGIFGDVVISATTNGVPVPAGTLITVILSGTTFSDGTTTKDFPATGTLDSVTISGLSSGGLMAGQAGIIVANYAGVHASAFLNVDAAPVPQSGNVYAWGYNAHGAAGDGTVVNPRTAPVAWVGGNKFNSIYGGYQHFAAVSTAGTVYMAGSNASGPFGNGTASGTSAKGPVGPALNEGLTAAFTDAARAVKTQAMYDQTTWIHGTDGRIYACGENSSDMFSLKDGTANGAADNPKGGLKPVGTQILNANPGKTILWASGNGWYRAAYLLSDGTVWNSGSNNYFGMGNNGTKGAQYLAAQTVTNTGAPLTNIVQVRVTQDATMYLDRDGNLWGAGSNTYGQLPGIGATTATAPAAVRLTQPAGKQVAQIWANSSDSESFFAKTTDGTFYAVGANVTGSNSVGHANRSTNTWEQVIVPADRTISDIAGGGNGNLFLMTDGSVFFAGQNNTGGPGTGLTSGNTTTMTQVPLNRRAIDIAATWYDSYAVILAD